MDVKKDNLYKRFSESDLNRCIYTLQVLGKSCFKAKKVPLEEYFFHSNNHFC